MPSERCKIGCQCGKHKIKPCPPGCDCGLHWRAGVTCPPGCNCGFHTRDKCPVGCTCARHDNHNATAVPCVPGCACAKHDSSPRGPHSIKTRERIRDSLRGRGQVYSTRIVWGMCKICNSDATELDHNHETQRVRGFLCLRCNTGLGFFNDSELRLLRAIYYLLLEDRSEFFNETRCAICFDTNFSGLLHEDHSHMTGVSRGLLCVRCNFGIERFHDNTQLLTSAINYLQHYREAA